RLELETGVYLIPSGTSTTNISSLFYSPRLSWLFARLRAEFDMVLIDTPPLMHLADARVLGRLADGVILVIRAGRTTTESALSVSRRIAEDGTWILGTVLNTWI